jgi:hypothetical protein
LFLQLCGLASLIFEAAHYTKNQQNQKKKKGGREEKLKVQKNITDQGKKCYLFIFSGRIPSLSSFLEV